MNATLPKYPLIAVYGGMVGSQPYYIADEAERAVSVKAPRDTWSAGHVNGYVQIKRWSEIKNEQFKQDLASACIARYGVHPEELLK